MRTKSAPKFEPSPLMGVYRFREKVGGCNAWYAVNCLGHIADFRVVRKGESEKRVVGDLVRLVYGQWGPGPSLTLIHTHRASSAQLSLLRRSLRAPQSPQP